MADDDAQDEQEEQEDFDADCDDIGDSDDDVLPSIKGMYQGAVMAQSRFFSWGSGWTETWEFEDADACSECGKIIRLTGPGEQRHDEINPNSPCDGYVSTEGPMMNYFYPLPSKDYDVKKLRGPVCLVKLLDTEIAEEEWGLALTGGGMDLSWEICEAYMRLNFLPPIHFVENLPRVGLSAASSDTRLWVLAGARESLRVVIGECRDTLKRLREMESRSKK